MKPRQGVSSVRRFHEWGHTGVIGVENGQCVSTLDIGKSRKYACVFVMMYVEMRCA